MSKNIKYSVLLIAINIIIIFGYQLFIRIDGGYVDAVVRGIAVALVATLGIINAKNIRKLDNSSIQGIGKLLIIMHILFAIIPLGIGILALGFLSGVLYI
jgi:hypothetical protein